MQTLTVAVNCKKKSFLGCYLKKNTGLRVQYHALRYTRNKTKYNLYSTCRIGEYGHWRKNDLNVRSGAIADILVYHSKTKAAQQMVTNLLLNPQFSALHRQICAKIVEFKSFRCYTRLGSTNQEPCPYIENYVRYSPSTDLKLTTSAKIRSVYKKIQLKTAKRPATMALEITATSHFLAPQSIPL